VTIDTAGNRLTLPMERESKVCGAAMALLSSAGTNRRFVCLMALQRMAGLAVSTNLAIPAAQLYTRAMYDDLRTRVKRHDIRSDRSSNDLSDRPSRHDRRLSHQ